jgi:hypothetical protein
MHLLSRKTNHIASFFAATRCASTANQVSGSMCSAATASRSLQSTGKTPPLRYNLGQSRTSTALFRSEVAVAIYTRPSILVHIR